MCILLSALQRSYLKHSSTKFSNKPFASCALFTFKALIFKCFCYFTIFIKYKSGVIMVIGIVCSSCVSK